MDPLYLSFHRGCDMINSFMGFYFMNVDLDPFEIIFDS